jgi:hypothetical protein
MRHREPLIPLVVMTVGHSTRPVAELIRLLKAHDVRRLVDVRRSCSLALPSFPDCGRVIGTRH